MQLYILDDMHDPVAVDEPALWVDWFSTTNRHVADTSLDDVRVSTVFLGIDCNHFSGLKPVLFETMVFTAGDPGSMEKYSTWEEAKTGHEVIVRAVESQQQLAQLVTIDSLAGILVGLRTKN